jgi:hypothetical protein
MTAPKLDDHQMPAGSNAYVDYSIPLEKDMKYKFEMVKQFVKAAEGKVLSFPNTSNHTRPFIIMVTDKGVRTQLLVHVATAEEMDELQEKANSLFKS